MQQPAGAVRRRLFRATRDSRRESGRERGVLPRPWRRDDRTFWLKRLSARGEELTSRLVRQCRPARREARLINAPETPPSGRAHRRVGPRQGWAGRRCERPLVETMPHSGLRGLPRRYPARGANQPKTSLTFRSVGVASGVGRGLGLLRRPWVFMGSAGGSRRGQTALAPSI